MTKTVQNFEAFSSTMSGIRGPFNFLQYDHSTHLKCLPSYSLEKVKNVFFSLKLLNFLYLKKFLEDFPIMNFLAPSLRAWSSNEFATSSPSTITSSACT